MNMGRTEHRGTQHKDPCLCPPSTSHFQGENCTAWWKMGGLPTSYKKHHYHSVMSCVSSVSHVRLSVTVACQALLSMGLSRQEYWSGLPFPPPGVFPTQELNPPLLRLLHCRWNFDPLTRWGSPSFKDTASIFHLEREAYNQYIPRRLITWGSCFLKPIKIIQKSVLPTSGLVLIKTHTGF